MKAMRAVSVVLAVAAGCATDSGQRERGPAGTIAYHVELESSEPGARVEVNGDYVGKTPMKIKVFGDDDGTFHNFGSILSVAMNGLAREGYEVAAMTSDDIVMKRPAGR
jgi:hypothetical protein